MMREIHPSRLPTLYRTSDPNLAAILEAAGAHYAGAAPFRYTTYFYFARRSETEQMALAHEDGTLMVNSKRLLNSRARMNSALRTGVVDDYLMAQVAEPQKNAEVA